jgi:hypothetical protein
MIRSYRRAADEADLKAMTQGKGSPVLNALPLTAARSGDCLWSGAG